MNSVSFQKYKIIAAAILFLFFIHGEAQNYSGIAPGNFSISYSNEEFIYQNSFNVPENQWIHYFNKANLLFEKVDFQSFLNYILFSKDGDMTDMPYFKKFINEAWHKDKEELIYKVGMGVIANEQQVKSFLSALQPKYSNYYTDFMKHRAVFIESENNNNMNRTPINNNPTPLNCGSPCTNPGFETGTTSFWDGWTGVACTSADPCALTTGFSTTQHVVTTLGTYDATVGGTVLPKVPPGGGNNALRLGNGAVSGSGAARISISFNVSAANANFTYRYAVVLEDPSSGHDDNERPYFRVKIRDAAGDVVTCGDYEVLAKPGTAQFANFIETNSGSDIWYRPWTTVFVPLSSYIGQCITVEFTSSDCSQTGHFGYAYVDGDCTPLGVLTSSPAVCGGNSVILTAPAGGASYAWSDTTGGTTGIVGSTTGQTATVSQAGTYQVVITSVAGITCITTLNITIGGSPISPVPQFSNDTACVGSVTQFTDSSTPAGNVTAWAWDFDSDGITDDTTQNPTHIFTNAGSHPVVLTVTMGLCSSTITKNITVLSGLNPAITPAGPFCSNGIAVNLAASVSGGTWSGTGITNATTGTFNPASAAIGNDTITYTTSGACPVSTSIAIVINPLPVSDAGADIAICTGTTGNLGVVATGGYTYGWMPVTGLNDPAISNPTVTLTNGGSVSFASTYTIATTVTSTGCFSEDQVDVTVNALPTVNAGLDQTICANSMAPLVGSIGGSATGVTWTGGLGTYNPSDTSIICIYTPSLSEITTGNVILTLTTNDPAGPCTAANDQMELIINPAAIVSAGVNQTICIGSTVTLAGVTGGSANNGIWSGGAGTFTPNNVTANAVYTPSAAEDSTGTVTLTYTTNDPSGPCPARSDQMMIIINQLATCNAGVPQSVCSGSGVTLSGTLGGSASSGKWSGGGGTYSPNDTTLNAVYTPTVAEFAAGSVTLTLTTNDPVGPCPFVSSTVTFGFYPNPNINYIVDNPAGCPIHCVNFTDQSTISGNDNIVTWGWNLGDGTTGAVQNPSHCYAQTGFYDITLTAASNHGCISSATVTQMIQVYAIPVAGFNPTPNPASVIDPGVMLDNQSSPDVNYWHWDFGDGDTLAPHSSSPVHLYPNQTPDSYLVTLIVHNTDGCYDTVAHEVFIGPEFTFYIPNAFSPNEDGKNDYFFGSGIGIAGYDLWILDRWGDNVFHSSNLKDKWNGKANNGSEEAQQDVYVWKVKITDVFGKKHYFIGTVTLIK